VKGVVLLTIVAVICVMPLVALTTMPVVLVEFPWAVITGFSGSVAVAPPSAVNAPQPPPAPLPLPPGAPASGVIAEAQTWLGVPYLFGGCSRSGVDCSCFVELVYAALGISLPRTTQVQWNATARVDQADLQPGDLVFFAHTYQSGDPITHVGIYLGSGMQINAPDTGQVVSIQPVFTGFWGAHFAGGGRPRR
jgi:cell wall-associated NlpC family hydrolase